MWGPPYFFTLVMHRLREKETHSRKKTSASTTALPPVQPSISSSTIQNKETQNLKSAKAYTADLLVQSVLASSAATATAPFDAAISHHGQSSLTQSGDSEDEFDAMVNEITGIDYNHSWVDQINNHNELKKSRER